MLQIRTVLENAGFGEMAQDGTISAHVNAIPHLANVVHPRNFSFEVLGPGKGDGELRFRVYQNVGSPPGG